MKPDDGQAARRPPDLRLAGFAIGVWLAALACLYLPAKTGLLLGGALLVAAVVAAIPALRREPELPPAEVVPAEGHDYRTAADWLAVLTRVDGTARSARPPGGPPLPEIDGVRPSFAAGWAGQVRAGRALAGRSRSRVARRVRDTGWSVRTGWVAGPVRWAIVAVLLGGGCGAAATGFQLAARDAGPLVALVGAGDGVHASGIVQDDPRALRGSLAGTTTYLVVVRLTEVRAGSAAPVRLSVGAIVLGDDASWQGLLPGQRFEADGQLLPPRTGELQAVALSVRHAPELVGRPPWVQRAAGVLREGLRKACAPLPAESGGLLPGLIDGDTSRLDPSLATDFQTVGMTHLLAVSGSNVAMILGVVLFAVRWTRASAPVKAIVCAAALAGFVILVRPSPSVLRAAAMGGIGLLGLASGRRRAALPALGAAAAALILWDPGLAADVGFTLSALATAGLLLIAPGWREKLLAAGWPPFAADALVVPAAAQVACGPVIAALSGAVSLVAIPANLIAVPAIEPATLLGVAAAVVSPIWPPGAQFLAWLAHWPAEWLVLVASDGARIPAAALPWPAGVLGALLLAVITVALLIAVRRPVVRRLAAVVALAGILGALPVRLVASGWPPRHWIIVVCAVGQGDSVVLPAGPGRAVVIDAGPEPQLPDQCLQRLGIHDVVLFIASHYHADHVGGISGVFRGRTVDAVAGPDWPDPPEGRRAVVAAAGSRGLHFISPGWSYTIGGLSLTSIGPFEALRGTNSDPNNNSLVLRARIMGETILLPGDAQTEEQDELLSRLPASALRADVLKVAHHGSAYQDPRFLAAVDPSVAMVSVGLHNDYGHPNPALLSRLARGGARVMRTDHDGDLAAMVTPTGLAVTTRGDPPTY